MPPWLRELPEGLEVLMSWRNTHALFFCLFVFFYVRDRREQTYIILRVKLSSTFDVLFENSLCCAHQAVTLMRSVQRLYNTAKYTLSHTHGRSGTLTQVTYTRQHTLTLKNTTEGCATMLRSARRSSTHLPVFIGMLSHVYVCVCEYVCECMCFCVRGHADPISALLTGWMQAA